MLRCSMRVSGFPPDCPATAADFRMLHALPLLVLAAAYLLGSVSGGVVLGRLRGIDIRDSGTGYASGGNALRTQGVVFALGVVTIDVAKGALAAWLGRRFGSPDGPFDVATLGYGCAFAAMLGDVWPIWHRFRGGKGAATLTGGLLVMWPWALPVLLLVWGGVLSGTGYLGLAMAAAACALPLLAWWNGASVPRWTFAIAAALFLLLTYRGNLRRLFAGGEARMERARVLHWIRRGGAR